MDGYNRWEAVLSSEAKGATYGATNGRQCSFRRPRTQLMAQPFYSRRPRTQLMAQPMGGIFNFGGRGRNRWRNQWVAVLLSAAEGVTHGATNGRPF